jgi:hypothetical protein
MFNQAIWWTCISLEVLLLVRSGSTKLLKKFPVFYSYLAVVLVTDLLAILIYRNFPRAYGTFYWSEEFLTAMVGYGVIAEIYNRSLKNYPGVAKFTRYFIFGILFVIAAKTGADLLSNSSISLTHAAAEMQRDLRNMQAILIVSFLGLFLYYQIPISRNLQGLIFGYALFTASIVIGLTFVSHPQSGFALLMRKLEPIVYVVSLMIWSIALWSPSPEPAVSTNCGIERDYKSLVQETRSMLLRARTHLVRTARP